MTRINLFIACNESTLILHQQLILIYFGKLKIVSQNRKCGSGLRKIRIKSNPKVEIYSRFDVLLEFVHFLITNVLVSAAFDEPHISMQVWEKYIGLKEPNIAKK